MKAFAYGRLHRYPSRTWERVLAQAHGRRAKRIGEADLIVIGAGAAVRTRERISADLAQRRQDSAVMSERSFLRRIGLLPALPAEARPYTAFDLAARAKLPGEQMELLRLFDVVEGDPDGRFSFRALKAVAQAADLLRSIPLADLAAACNQLRYSRDVGEPLAELQLTSEAGGKIALLSGGNASELDGQLRLGFSSEAIDVGALLAEAAEARETGDVQLAAKLNRRALSAAPRDLDVLFDLGSLLCEAGDYAEGITLLRRAVRLDPGFADAFYNIGHAFERQGRREEARQAYERAAAADRGYADPLFNLGMLALDENRFVEAVEQLEAYLRLDPSSDWSSRARKAATLARMSIQAGDSPRR